MTLTGYNAIGQHWVKGTREAFSAIDPSTNQALDTAFFGADIEQMEQACELAYHAFRHYRKTSASQRAQFLNAIGKAIMALGDTLILRAMAETGLPQARLEGERGRTVGQLAMFADSLQRGLTTVPRLDSAMPERTPLPRADLRLGHIPLGPVAIFGASNFPLAFSVAGGDTASALAAGCPVIVKAHSAHPGTSELIAHAILSAASETEMPDGVFSLLFDSHRDIGQGLVAHPLIKAVGFTGSRAGGTALMQLAQQRPEPIPVYAEMSSINPVCLMPDALASRGTQLVDGFCTSLQMGAGQFCTNPGLVIGFDSPELERFTEQTAEKLNQTTSQTMLTPGIHSAYEAGVGKWIQSPQVAMVAEGERNEKPNQCTPYLFSTTADAFLADQALREEVFGAASLVVKCRDMTQFIAVIHALDGQLTATLHCGEHDAPADVQAILDELELKVGRVLFNGFPTGVEVCYAMVHGGPFPATSDARTTSVGATAIERFLRPVCYQDVPNDFLPEALRDGPSKPIYRLEDGVLMSYGQP
ncbi:aldehyde dehydrogenase (NADP(+)) [Thaumasiovibrio subtropicus]|uniref:aldehyde dehydrogenase (NADP(+)) n=1 Tax=Thaumasiovibrio subtropicus TaxID=1891207 RepID=UPI000B35981F|nr:aldehyde dehydrogenase (NADP(+)) [Thaumasiovibrio subtropicus]